MKNRNNDFKEKFMQKYLDYSFDRWFVRLLTFMIIISLISLFSSCNRYGNETEKESSRIKVIERSLDPTGKLYIIKVDSIEYLLYSNGGIIKHQ